jgi:hypothetical protein
MSLDEDDQEALSLSLDDLILSIDEVGIAYLVRKHNPTRWGLAMAKSGVPAWLHVYGSASNWEQRKLKESLSLEPMLFVDAEDLKQRIFKEWKEGNIIIAIQEGAPK